MPLLLEERDNKLMGDKEGMKRKGCRLELNQQIFD